MINSYMNFISQKLNLKLIIQLSIVFFIGMILARNHLIISSIGSGFESPYENFYSEMINSEHGFFNNRACNESYTLEERKKLRWVGQKIKNNIFEKSYDVFGPRGLAASFITLHAFLIMLCYFFTKASIHKIAPRQNLSNETEHLTLLLFLTLVLYIFNGHTSEFSFSIIEGACIAAAIYFSKLGRIILFILVVCVSILNRESGFLIMSLWFIFNPILIRHIAFFLLPITLFLSVNYDVISCMTDTALYLGSEDFKINKSINNNGDFISLLIGVMFNHGVFILLMLTILQFARKNHPLFNIIMRIFIVYLLYTIVFMIFTPISHLSIKYIIVPLVVISSIIFLSKPKN
tara:strand:- start:734 stop:1777 length:1044 start_codon:yes stop_codon:yes gene_type:complete